MEGDPRLAHTPEGSSVDLVIEAGAGSAAVALWHKEHITLLGLDTTPGEVWTLYGASYHGFRHGAYLLEVNSATRTFKKPLTDYYSFLRMKEVCAGMGGISIGLTAAGGSTSVFLDRTEVACCTLRLNQGLPICGDLEDREARISLHAEAADCQHLLSAGIPCQGYSRQGLQQGFRDPRSQTVVQVLRVAWHTQCCGLILECVSEIQKHPEAIQCLANFASKAGFAFHQTVLDLADQWASKRLRWWAVMLPCNFPPFSLLAWPAATPSVMVQDVIPVWPIWPSQDEASLQWTEAEVQAYGNPVYGTEPKILDGAGKCPTALHSWGAALRACPCGCRMQGFSEARLRQQGLRGIGVPASSVAGTRFLHPQEAGLLNTIPPAYVHHPDPRTALCLIGQVAAPLQSLWICAQVRQWAANVFELPAPEPLQLLQDFKRLLLQQRHHKWCLRSMCQSGFVELRDAHGSRRISCQGPVQVHQLLAAEMALHEPGFILQLWHRDSLLTGHDFLHLTPEGEVYSLQALPQRESFDAPCVTTSSTQGSADGEITEPSGMGHSTEVELNCGLQVLCSALRPSQAAALPAVPVSDLPAILEAVIRPQHGVVPSPGSVILTPFLHDHHWSLLVLYFPALGQLEVTLYDGIPGRNTAQGQQVATLLSGLLPDTALVFREEHFWLQRHASSCGVFALAHAAAALEGRASPVHLQRAVAFLLAFPKHCFRLVGKGALSGEQHAQLGAVLVDKGVPEAQVAGRIQAATLKIGAGPLAQALSGRNVWQLLKSAANKPGTAFRWITPEELQEHINKRAQEKFGTEVPRAKQKKQKSSRPALDRDKLILRICSWPLVPLWLPVDCLSDNWPFRKSNPKPQGSASALPSRRFHSSATTKISVWMPWPCSSPLLCPWMSGGARASPTCAFQLFMGQRVKPCSFRDRCCSWVMMRSRSLPLPFRR